MLSVTARQFLLSIARVILVMSVGQCIVPPAMHRIVYCCNKEIWFFNSNLGQDVAPKRLHVIDLCVLLNTCACFKTTPTAVSNLFFFRPVRQCVKPVPYSVPLSTLLAFCWWHGGCCQEPSDNLYAVLRRKCILQIDLSFLVNCMHVKKTFTALSRVLFVCRWTTTVKFVQQFSWFTDHGNRNSIWWIATFATY